MDKMPTRADYQVFYDYDPSDPTKRIAMPLTEADVQRRLQQDTAEYKLNHNQ